MPEPLRIAFFGSSLVSAYWNGAATYYRGIVRALAERGHRITFYEPDAYGRQQHRDMEDPPWARVVVYPAGAEEDAWRVLEDARGANVVVKASGVGVFDRMLERGVLDLKRPRTRVVFWDVDAAGHAGPRSQRPGRSFPAADSALRLRIYLWRRRSGGQCLPCARRARLRAHL